MIPHNNDNCLYLPYFPLCIRIIQLFFSFWLIFSIIFRFENQCLCFFGKGAQQSILHWLVSASQLLQCLFYWSNESLHWTILVRSLFWKIDQNMIEYDIKSLTPRLALSANSLKWFEKFLSERSFSMQWVSSPRK